MSQYATELGYKTSFVEHLFNRPLYELSSFNNAHITQERRSHPAILTIANELFYNGSLVAKAPAGHQNICKIQFLNPSLESTFFNWNLFWTNVCYKYNFHFFTEKINIFLGSDLHLLLNPSYFIRLTVNAEQLERVSPMTLKSILSWTMWHGSWRNHLTANVSRKEILELFYRTRASATQSNQRAHAVVSSN